jgi:hypothetical protein
MNTHFRSNRTRTHTQRIPRVLALATTLMLGFSARAALTPVPLGTDSGFAVLAGSGITVAGAGDSTTITGDIGSDPTPAITGLGNVVLNGVNQSDDAVAQGAQADLQLAFGNAAGRPATMTFAPVSDLGGLTLAAGVYNDPTSFGLTGNLTLDAQGNPNAVFIFQTGSTLVTAADSAVVLIDGAQAGNVFWEIGSSATLGADSEFTGNLLALTSITLGTGAAVDGRLLALNGDVTLDGNTLAIPTVPDAAATLPTLGFALALLIVLGRRKAAGLTPCRAR